MAHVLTKQLDKPDEVRRHPNGTVEIYALDDIVIGRTTFQPGWHWAEHVKPLAGTELCMYHHVGVCLQGRSRLRMADGSEMEVGAGMVFDIPPGHDSWVVSDEPWVTYDVAGMRAFARTDQATQKVLGAILFTDIVDSTATAERLGARQWKALLEAHIQATQYELDRYRGRLVKTTGDGVLALFDGAERAVMAAAAIVKAAEAQGIAIRAGVHSGEVELEAGDVRGMAVHMASRVMAAAPASGVLVSATTYELLAGSGLVFDDAGNHELKGITGARKLYSLSIPA